MGSRSGRTSITISADEALAAAPKRVTSGAIDFLQQVLSDGPMDQTEIVRLGKEAGYSEKNLRTARERLGIKPKKEGFGADGKWVWVPTSSATALKLVVDNDANKQTPADGKQPPGGAGGGADNKAPDSHHAVQDARAVEPGKPGGRTGGARRR